MNRHFIQALALAGVALPALASATTLYELVDLGSFGVAFPNAVNDAGLGAGVYQGQAARYGDGAWKPRADRGHGSEANTTPSSTRTAPSRCGPWPARKTACCTA